MVFTIFFFEKSAEGEIWACADPGIFTRGVQARLPENSSDNVVFYQSSTIYSSIVVNQWFISKETLIFLGFRGVQHFPRGEGGSNIFKGVQLLPGGSKSKC